MTNARLQQEAVLRVGEVTEVTGRKISVTVDKDKNLSELFFDGELIRNVAVGIYIDIRKGFFSLIGKVDGEYARPDTTYLAEATKVPNSKRSLSITLVGYVDRYGTFFGGTKELPLVGNEAYLLTSEKVHQIHNLVSEDAIPLNVAVSDYEGFEISLPVDGLMNSHIAIFGNTGSGKSNTVALLYQSYIEAMRNRNQDLFDQRVRILFFDFNGEYSRENCLTPDKTVYNLSTRHDQGDKVPLSEAGFLDFETLAILSDATEKTQRPFIRRALGLTNRIGQGEDGRDEQYPPDPVQTSLDDDARRSWQRQVDGCKSGGGEQRTGEEDPMPGEMIDDHAAYHQPAGRSRRCAGNHQADAHRYFPRRQIFAHQPHAEREDGAGKPLEASPGEEHWIVG